MAALEFFDTFTFCGRCGKDKNKIFKEGETIEILKVVGLIDSINQ